MLFADWVTTVSQASAQCTLFKKALTPTMTALAIYLSPLLTYIDVDNNVAPGN